MNQLFEGPNSEEYLIELIRKEEFELIPDGFWNDRKFMVLLIKHRPDKTHVNRDLYRSSRKIAQAMISRPGQGSLLFDLPDHFRNDRKMILSAVLNSPKIYRHLTPDQKEDDEISTNALKCDRNNFEYLPERFRFDPDILAWSLAELHGDNIAHTSLELKDNEEIAKMAIYNHEDAYHHLSERLKMKKEIVIFFVREHPWYFGDLPEVFRFDREIVKIAISTNGFCFGNISFSSPELKDDKELGIMAINTDMLSYHSLSPRLQNDIDIVRLHIELYPFTFSEMSEDIRNNREITELAIRSPYSTNLHFASPTMRDDKELAIFALKQDKYIYECLSSRLKGDIDILTLRG